MNNFLGIQKEQLNLVQSGKIVKADEYLTYKTAAEVIQEAKTDAELIIAEAEEVYQEKKAEGYQHGIEEGRAELIMKILEATDKANNYIQGKESQIVDVVVTAMNNILGEFDDIELSLSVVKKAIDELQGHQQVTLRVIPDQTKNIAQALQEISKDGLLVRVAADSQLQSGQCVLESDLGIIECSIDDQIDAIKTAMTLSLTKEKIN